MRATQSISVLAILALCCSPAAAAEKRMLALEDCVRIGIARNLQLKNASLDADTAEEKAEAAKSPYDTRLSLAGNTGITELQNQDSFVPGEKEITQLSAGLAKAFSSGTTVAFNFGHNSFIINETNSIGGSLFPPYSSTATLSLSQSIMKNAFGEVDRAVLAMADGGKVIADQLYIRQVHALEWQISRAYWNLYAARRSHATAVNSVNLAGDLVRVNRKRVADGLLEETDLLAAEALLATREVDVLFLRNASENAADRLKSVLNIAATDWDNVDFEYPDRSAWMKGVAGWTPTLKSDKVTVVALSKRPDLAATREVIKQAKRELKIVKSQARPDLKVQASISQGSSGIDSSESLELDDGAWVVGLILDVPLWRTGERSRVRQAELLLKKAENDVSALETVIAVECRTAVRSFGTARQRIEAADKAAGLHGKKLILERKKFDQGRSAFRWIVQYEDDFSSAEVSKHLAAAEFQKSMAFLRFVQGIEMVGISEKGGADK